MTKNGRLRSSETVNRFGLLKRPPGFFPKRYRFGTLTGLVYWEESRNRTVSELLNGSETGKMVLLGGKKFEKIKKTLYLPATYIVKL